MLAARTCFARDGFERASLETIASEAGVSSATLYKHFRTKSDLFVAAVQALRAEQGLPAIPDSAPVARALEQLLSAYAELLTRPGTPDLFRSVIAEVSREPELAEVADEGSRQAFARALCELLARGIARGEIRSSNLELSAELLLGMVKAVVFWPAIVKPGTPIGAKQKEDAVREACAWFLSRHRAAEAPRASESSPEAEPQAHGHLI